MKREKITQLEESLYRYFIAKDSADRYLIYPLIVDLLRDEMIDRFLVEYFSKVLLSDEVFTELQEDDFFFLERMLRGLFSQISDVSRKC